MVRVDFIGELHTKVPGKIPTSVLGPGIGARDHSENE